MSTLRKIPLVSLAALALLTRGASAQEPAGWSPAELVSANSEWERYLRVLQLTGHLAPAPWSVRGLGPAHLALLQPSDTVHPWRERTLIGVGESSRRLSIIAPESRVFYNTAFPFGYNDGPVWAGRGVTASVTGGVAVQAGPLSVTVAPVIFTSQNRAFHLMPNGRTGAQVYADGRRPYSIDQPQRFGDARYTAVDWGNSTARLDAAGLSVGVSTAVQQWGPAVEHPVLLGNNAAGFVHVFAGTSKPVDIWLGDVHGRLIWGRLEQSDFATTARAPRRMAAGLVGVFRPRGATGLELGAGRFFHVPWPDSGFTRDHLLKPLEGLLKQTLATPDNPTGDVPDDNQLASVFARWVFPSGGLEVYGELGREDHSWDALDLWLEPDHDIAYLLGMQKAWGSAAGILVARAEVLNTRISHLQEVRSQTRFYVHSPIVQGHTHRGQVLGSAGGFGGGASVIGVDLFRSTGRLGASWSRLMRGEAIGAGGIPAASRADVMHAFAVEGMVFGRGMDIVGGMTAVRNYNRDHAGDVFNLNATVGIRGRW